MRIALCMCAVFAVCAGVWAQPPGTRVIQLKWLDANVLVAMLSDRRSPTDEEIHRFRQQWVTDLAGQVARRLPRNPERMNPQWYYASSMNPVPGDQIQPRGFDSPSRLLPEGMEPPIVLMGQNAILAKGTPAQIDQLQEIITLLDVKPKMVNVEVELQDNPIQSTNEWGIDGGISAGDLTIATQGNAPASGLQARYRRGRGNALVGRNRTNSSGNTVTAANVTTTNNFPALITFGRLLPYFNTSVTYDAYGNRSVSTEVDAVFIGTQLFVQPRINGDSTVTMLLQPTFVEAVGSITGPNGISLPITETVGTMTQVTVPDGVKMQIGGFERGLSELNARSAGMMGERSVSIQSHPQLFVTPHIIHDGE